MQRDMTIWMANTLDLEDLYTLRDHGAINGVPYMTYYHETSELYQKFSQDVWDAVGEYCESNGFGLDDILINIIGRGCDSHAAFANSMVWFAAEAYAQAAIFLKLEKAAESEEEEADA